MSLSLETDKTSDRLSTVESNHTHLSTLMCLTNQPSSTNRPVLSMNTLVDVSRFHAYWKSTVVIVDCCHVAVSRFKCKLFKVKYDDGCRPLHSPPHKLTTQFIYPFLQREVQFLRLVVPLVPLISPLVASLFVLGCRCPLQSQLLYPLASGYV